MQSIRTQVFIEEQQIDPADEWDPADQTAIHLLAERDGEPVGCARVLDLTKIGRMAVLKDVRRKNVGSKLLRAAISKIQSAGNTPALGAQITAMGFYANHGFLPEGPVFDDAGIPHRTMTITGDPRKTLMPLDGESLRFDTPTLLVAIEPRYADGEMRINLLKLSDDEAAWLTPRLCCYASTHGANTLIIESLKVRYASSGTTGVLLLRIQRLIISKVAVLGKISPDRLILSISFGITQEESLVLCRGTIKHHISMRESTKTLNN